MTTNEPVPGAQGQQPEQSLIREVPFTKSLQQITGDVFVGTGDSEDSISRQASGFIVVESPTWTVDQQASALRAGATTPIPMWVRNPSNFRGLVGLVAKDNPILKEIPLTENELRYLLFAGAEAEKSSCSLYIARDQIVGSQENKVHQVNSVQEAQVRIAGLEEFQRNLLERQK